MFKVAVPLVALLALAAAAHGAPLLEPGHLLLIDGEGGWDPFTQNRWAFLYMADPDVDTAAETPVFLYEDAENMPRTTAVIVENRREILYVDSAADPSGLGPDLNPENFDADPDNNTGGHGAVFRVDLEAETTSLISDGTDYEGTLPALLPSAFVGPRDMLRLPDGDILVADPDADPSGFGTDPFNHVGYGALLRVDPETGRVSLVSDGSFFNGNLPDYDGDTVPDPSVFWDPWAITQDPNDPGFVYLLDISADPTEQFYIGAVFRVSLANGLVDTVASDARFDFLTDIAWWDRLGALLVLDATSDVPPAPVAYQVSIGSVEPWAQPAGWSYPVGIFTSEPGEAYVVDSDANPLNLGDPDPPPIGPGAAFRLEDSNPDNPPVVNSSLDYIYLWGGASIPVLIPEIDPAGLSPLCCTTTEKVISILGTGFDQNARVTTDDQIEILSTTWVDLTRIDIRVRVDCLAAEGPHDIRVTNPNMTTDVTVLDVFFNPSVNIPPVSPVGDINLDLLIDGLDLADLGLAFGANACTDPTFDNDADLNDDGVVDGLDLTVFAPSFGTRLSP